MAAGGFLLVGRAVLGYGGGGLCCVWWGFEFFFFPLLLRFLNLEFVRGSVIVVVVCGGGFWLVVTATWLFGSIWIGFE